MHHKPYFSQFQLTFYTKEQCMYYILAYTQYDATEDRIFHCFLWLIRSLERLLLYGRNVGN